MIYYVDGDFMSRKNVTRGMDNTATCGHTAAARIPGLLEKVSAQKETKELAVMVEHFQAV